MAPETPKITRAPAVDEPVDHRAHRGIDRTVSSLVGFDAQHTDAEALRPLERSAFGLPVFGKPLDDLNPQTAHDIAAASFLNP